MKKARQHFRPDTINDRKGELANLLTPITPNLWVQSSQPPSASHICDETDVIKSCSISFVCSLVSQKKEQVTATAGWSPGRLDTELLVLHFDAFLRKIITLTLSVSDSTRQPQETCFVYVSVGLQQLIISAMAQQASVQSLTHGSVSNIYSQCSGQFDPCVSRTQ